MGTRKKMAAHFGVTIGSMNLWIRKGRVPSTLENLKTGLWDESVIEKIEYVPRVTLDTELIREMAKTKTVPEDFLIFT